MHVVIATLDGPLLVTLMQYILYYDYVRSIFAVFDSFSHFCYYIFIIVAMIILRLNQFHFCFLAYYYIIL